MGSTEILQQRRSDILWNVLGTLCKGLIHVDHNLQSFPKTTCRAFAIGQEKVDLVVSRDKL